MVLNVHWGFIFLRTARALIEICHATAGVSDRFWIEAARHTVAAHKILNREHGWICPQFIFEILKGLAPIDQTTAHADKVGRITILCRLRKNS